MVLVDVALATICFLQGADRTCYSALVGPSTPRGEFSMTLRLTQDPGYGGSVLQFHEDDHQVYAIHQTWTLRPSEKRVERLASPDPAQRSITKGCVNIDPAVYRRLLTCCSNQKLVIK